MHATAKCLREVLTLPGLGSDIWNYMASVAVFVVICSFVKKTNAGAGKEKTPSDLRKEELNLYYYVS